MLTEAGAATFVVTTVDGNRRERIVQPLPPPPASADDDTADGPLPEPEREREIRIEGNEDDDEWFRAMGPQARAHPPLLRALRIFTMLIRTLLNGRDERAVDAALLLDEAQQPRAHRLELTPARVESVGLRAAHMSSGAPEHDHDSRLLRP